MNTENVQNLRDYLADLRPEQFTTDAWALAETGFRPQNLRNGAVEATVKAGIGGWANVLSGGLYGLRGATSWLGLSPQEADALFHPIQDDVPLSAAVRVLEILLTEGVVDWGRATAE